MRLSGHDVQVVQNGATVGCDKTVSVWNGLNRTFVIKATSSSGNTCLCIGNRSSRRGPTRVASPELLHGQSVGHRLSLVSFWKRISCEPCWRAFHRVEHDRQTFVYQSAAVDRVDQRRGRVENAMERSVMGVHRRLHFDRLPIGQPAMVLAGLGSLAESDRRETVERTRYRRKFNLEGWVLGVLFRVSFVFARFAKRFQNDVTRDRVRCPGIFVHSNLAWPWKCSSRTILRFAVIFGQRSACPFFLWTIRFWADDRRVVPYCGARQRFDFCAGCVCSSPFRCVARDCVLRVKLHDGDVELVFQRIELCKGNVEIAFLLTVMW